MDALPEFELLRPRHGRRAVAARAAHPDSRLLGGGTDLVVNIRRGIVAPPGLIDLNHVPELRAIAADATALAVGAAVTLAELAEHAQVLAHYPVVAQAAGSIAGPTHRHMGTVGGNLASIRAASSTTSRNGGVPPTIIASRPPGRSATWRPRAMASLRDLLGRSRSGLPDPRCPGRSRRPAGRRTLPLAALIPAMPA